MLEPLRAVLHLQMRRRWVGLEQTLHRFDDLSRIPASADSNRQAEPAVFIDHND